MRFRFQQGISPLTHSSSKVSLNFGAIHTGIWKGEGGIEKTKGRRDLNGYFINYFWLYRMFFIPL